MGASAEAVKIGVLTSGGDAQGMNGVVRAVVRTALHEGARPFAIHEGWKGAVDGGDLIREMEWKDAGGILSEGGTSIGTARSDEFRTRDGIKKAVKNLVFNGIDRLVVIGGDGTLSGADELRELWPELLAELAKDGDIDSETAKRHERLHIAGVVGSIDNDLVGSDMTVGADSALHRIIEAIDAISSTAASHQRTFIIEVMGRRCGYLAMVAAIAGGCDYVLIPELPPADGWEDAMCEKLKIGRERGRRESIVIVAEGATDREGNPITSNYVKEVLAERLGEDARVTALGHVQRGGTPSAYDRWMPTLLGYTAAHELINADENTEPLIVGTQQHHIVLLPLMQTIENTRAVKKYLQNGQWDEAVASRGAEFGELIDVFTRISKPTSESGEKNNTDSPRAPRVAILHGGGLAPGMNPAARAAVKLGIERGFTMLGIQGGFQGLLEGAVRELRWGDVEGWAEDGGAKLGTRRTIPSSENYYKMARAIEDNDIDALIMIGGFKGYRAVYDMYQQRDHYPAFKIPMVCVPASIDNNLPGCDMSIGADTALNSNASTLDKIRQSAEASRRCFVTETMGRKSGYLALMSAITTGAEQVYLYEDGITLAGLAADVQRMIQAFEQDRTLYLVVRNEDASEYYTTDMLRRIFEQEGGDTFDVRTMILGHAQQGGNPSPSDRALATRLVDAAINELDELLKAGKTDAVHIGHHHGRLETYPVNHMPDLIDMADRLPYDPWWRGLKNVLYVLSNPHFNTDLGRLPIVEDLTGTQHRNRR
ncbi:MAG: 6-phosphofructokinase [Actinomycetaceae bacterium]|nr:6-phosphofructokinase [Actinomycetaceae bacterium]